MSSSSHSEPRPANSSWCSSIWRARSIPARKSEVERRRATDPPGNPALTRELTEAFALGEIMSQMVPVSYTPMGRTWCLETARGKFAVGPVCHWVRGAQAELADTLREKARAGGVLAPKAVRAADGELVKTIAGEGWRVDEWIETGPAPLPPVRASVAAKVGEAMATIHGLAMASDAPISWFVSNQRSDDEWQELIDRARHARKPFANEVAARLPAIRGLGAAVTDAPPSPPVLTHNNLIPENVRTVHNDGVAVLSWDFAGAMPVEWEIASALLQWGRFGAGLHPPALRGFVSGYATRAGALPALEVSSFSAAICGWLNWFYNQVCAAIDAGAGGPAAASFAEEELRDLLDDPLSVATIEELLASLAPVTG